ncbi:uncharacterized protein LOC111618533 isoform X2 [Centruroides sculpturatus]|nr:uncharacterized protein LOC111618533 isoform X2 [Centruroides sculpturatus]
MISNPIANLIYVAIFSISISTAARVTFLKMTNLEYSSTTYYTLRNLSLYECRRWCREEQDCVAATFRYVVTPLAPIVETTCYLHNETQARKPSVAPRSATNTYYLIKMYLKAGNADFSLSTPLQSHCKRSYFIFFLMFLEKTCDRLWSYERYPNRMLKGLDNAIVFTSDPESCLSACANEERFICRSVEFNYVTLECHLSEFDLRSQGVQVQMVDSQGVDYFENSCLQANQVCFDRRYYGYTQLGLPQAMIRHFVSRNYYPDKQVLVSSRDECLRQCTMENAFVCRSLFFSPDSRPGKSTCILYHLDHFTFPEGADLFQSLVSKTIIDLSQTGGVYLESICDNSTAISAEAKTSPSVFADVTQQTTTSSTPSEDRDPSCDAYGVCYDVSIKCTDKKIVIFVQTNRPFHGRVYALGRSETCNSNIHNGQKFELDVSLTGQDCNTQSMGGVYTNTVVLQHHNVVLTKADKVYNVRCTYETTSRNVTFGMMPVSSLYTLRDPDMLQVTSAPEAPQPKIVIFGADGREASTVRIGDKLTFHIKIPENTPYGIFARSCVAMAKDARSTFEIIDERGCPVDQTIFPSFMEVGNALESTYEAFRFTESYGVIFQCNVKYCIGKCEPAVCTTNLGREESWGRKKRSPEKSNDEMTLSHEILVLDFGDEISRSMTERSHSANESYTVRESITYLESCASRTSILALAVTSSLLLILYVCTVGYFLGQRRSRSMKTFH